METGDNVLPNSTLESVPVLKGATDFLRTTDPPANLPTEIVNTLNESSPEQLRDVSTYAEALAEHKERETRPEESVAVDWIMFATSSNRLVESRTSRTASRGTSSSYSWYRPADDRIE
ncbi:hypothetical protein SAMN05192554_12419 [Haloarchaeobius iranensis]|uniref:Uncharacterized protein n=1 Tax=Haloarchaeobius iranensis TaxID=996166 RepID=A0A1H0A4C2_9EURY|nr:hypothetical protein [Haloarchaeobius iranensis]SDN27556.1 hypothetical protein SAMN05192554_12419 [Haloarchaeobius iranensis]